MVASGGRGEKVKEEMLKHPVINLSGDRWSLDLMW